MMEGVLEPNLKTNDQGNFHDYIIIARAQAPPEISARLSRKSTRFYQLIRCAE